MKKCLLIFFALVTAIVASSKEPLWVYASSVDDESYKCLVYSDIKHPTSKHSFYEVWVKRVYSTPSVKAMYETDAEYSMTLYEISKDFREYRRLEAFYYDDEGSVIETLGAISKASHVIPESKMESIVEIVKEITDAQRRAASKKNRPFKKRP